MFKRLLELPNKSFFLLGPRGTGKSTLLMNHTFDLVVDLLSASDLFDYRSNPGKIYTECAHLPERSWILVDEVQRVPELLDEVHRLYENKHLNFALSGSSARKLKRAGANLLAGRAINLSIYPLCWGEYRDQLDLEFRILWGTLPIVVDNRDYLQDTVKSYVHNYLQQEIAEEGIVRKLDLFARFLRVAAAYQGKMLNFQTVAEHSGVGRSTVAEYFQILFDTLIAYRLPAWQPKLKVREIKTPKFYLFDSGVARACFGLNNEIDHSYRGYLLETLILNEIRAYTSYYKKDFDLYYYSVSDSFEIDIVVDLGRRANRDSIVAIEVKLSKRWDPRWSSAFGLLDSEGKITIERKIGIYTGEKRLTVDGVDVYPVDLFLEELFSGKIL